MQVFEYPKINEWASLCLRPQFEKNNLIEVVSQIINQVKKDKDKALFQLSEKFDNASLNRLLITEEEINFVCQSISKELIEAIQVAKNNIEKFHIAQKENIQIIETSPGVKCWRKSMPIEKIGLYIPGGSAPLFSTILMLGIPAKIAACKEIILCTPPNKEGEINPVILFTAKLVGINQIFKVGGAQAIAAMAYGTESIPQVYKIFGPGNQFVTKAKELIQQDGIAIDMPAGPSEVLIIADQTSKPDFIASDLLAQAEHGADSQVILLSDDAQIIRATIKALKIQLQDLPRKDITTKALENSRAILLDDMKTCIKFSNQYAPEHLIIASENADDYINDISNAGSVFLGNYSCESAGDYASGTNHTLPTNGYAKNYSGVSLDSFVKKITFQKLNKKGLQNIGPAIEIMAEAEQLQAHKNAVSIRLKSLELITNKQNSIIPNF